MVQHGQNQLPGTPGEVAKQIDQSYQHYRGWGGLVARWRPYICPFEELLARIPQSKTMLDVGCGVGSVSVLAAQVGLVEYGQGIDIDEKVIEVAKRAHVSPQSSLDWQVMPKNVWPEGKFDTVLCVDVLHHVARAEQRAFVGKLSEAVRPGGRLLFKDISPRPKWKALANSCHDLVMAQQLVNYQAEQLVADWLEEEGMEIVEMCRLDRLWYGHYLVVAEQPLKQVEN